MSLIVARPGASCSGGTTPVVVNTTQLPGITIQALVTPGNTIDVDTISMTNWCASKWYIVVTTTSSSRMMAYEILSTTDINGTSFNTYSIVGDTIVQIGSVSFTAGNLVLQVANNDTEDLIIYATRFAIPVNPSVLPTISGIPLTHVNSYVAAGNIAIVDQITYPLTSAAKWVVSITDTLGNKTVFQVYALFQGGLTGNEVVYGMVGSTTLNYVVDVNIVQNTLQLTIQNNDSTNYRITALRIPVQPILPSSIQPSGDVTPWIPPVVTVAPGATISVDSQVPVPGHDAVKWLVGIVNSTTLQIESMEVVGMTTTITTPTTLAYSMVGSVMNIGANVVVSTNLNMNLMITNNESSSVRVYLVRLPVTI